MTFAEFENASFERQAAEAREKAAREVAEGRAKTIEQTHRVTTPRDGYGWRGLPGTSYLGAQPPKRKEEPTP